MKKTIFAVLLGLVGCLAFAQTDLSDLRQACRRILYAVNPVDAIAKVDEASLTTMLRYSLMGAKGQQPDLNETDAYLFAWLSNTEFTRRDSSADEFSLYLQDRREALGNRMANTQVIKIDGWIDLFQLNLLLGD